MQFNINDTSLQQLPSVTHIAKITESCTIQHQWIFVRYHLLLKKNILKLIINVLKLLIYYYYLNFKFWNWNPDKHRPGLIIHAVIPFTIYMGRTSRNKTNIPFIQSPILKFLGFGIVSCGWCVEFIHGDCHPIIFCVPLNT